MFRVVHAAKAKALNKLGKWAKTKSYAEEMTCAKDTADLQVSAHPDATYPPPGTQALRWRVSGQGILTVDVSSVSNVLLCMEPSLAQAYLIAIKNVEACHTHCMDVMKFVSQIVSFALCCGLFECFHHDPNDGFGATCTCENSTGVT